MLVNNSIYGNFRQVTFTGVWDNAESFLAEYRKNPLSLDEISDTDATKIFYLLYANYGNSVLASSDTNRFKYSLFDLIGRYAPTWLKRLDIQRQLRAISLDDFRQGSTQIVQQALNPGNAPEETETDENGFLKAINQQSGSKYKTSVADAYANMWSLLRTDVTTDFVDKFKRLFITVVRPEEPLWYASKDYDEGEE